MSFELGPGKFGSAPVANKISDADKMPWSTLSSKEPDCWIAKLTSPLLVTTGCGWSQIANFGNQGLSEVVKG